MCDVVLSSRARRQLFIEDVIDDAKNDNTANMLLELIKMDQEENMRKYNFDFENETPLEGTYKWTKIEGYYHWSGAENKSEEREDEKNVDMKEENEATPKTKEAGPIRKRRTDSDTDGKAVRRKIDFD